MNEGGINVLDLATVLLTVLFVGLKLAHVIAWSWWWVLSPIWLPIAIVVACGIIAAYVEAVRS